MMPPFEANIEFARTQDKADKLLLFKNRFHFPVHNGKPVIYFCGNSLGLQPKTTSEAIEIELQSWREIAVVGYFKGSNPWLYYQEYMKPSLAKMVGGLENEVTVMNALTVNLHLLMLSFYKPRGKRTKIIMEAGAFPSDQYAVETLIKHYDLNPDEHIIELFPKEGKKTLDTADIIATIEAHKESLAMVLLGGINYYTGQFFDIPTITKATHDVGAIAAFDLAHVVGNIPLQLHDWQVDFAVWCSYKYLNGGPGAVGGVFVHETHAANTDTPRLAGWWGNDEKERFKMEKGFIPKQNASGWNISTAQVFNSAALKASLAIFDEARIEIIREKSIALTGYLEFLLNRLTNLDFEIITPSNHRERGAQLSLFFKEKGKQIHQAMLNNGIIVDYREPGVIRVAPAPLYCSFEDVYRFYEILNTIH